MWLLGAAVRCKSSGLSHTGHRGSGVFVPSAPLPRALWASPLRAFHCHPQQSAHQGRMSGFLHHCDPPPSTVIVSSDEIGTKQSVGYGACAFVE